MNKKAMGEGWSMMVSLITLIIIITFFWISSFTDRGTIREETSHQLEITNVNIDLLNLLRTEVDDTTFSDLIITSYTNNDYSKLTTKVNHLFLNNFNKDYCWTLSVDSFRIHDICGGDQVTSEAKLPTLDSKDLTIKLIRYGKAPKPAYARSKS